MATSYCDYSIKYQPTLTEDIYSNFKQISDVKQFLKNYDENPKKKIEDRILLIQGPSGSCKTTLCKCIFNECNYEPIVIDMFSAINIKNTIAQGIKHNTIDAFFSKKKKILFLDDIDLICQYEKSLIAYIVKLIRIIQIPIICTANSIDDKKISEIKKKATKILLSRIWYKDCVHFINNVIEKEKLDIDADQAIDIIKKNNNDIRLILSNLSRLNVQDENDEKSNIISEKDQFIDYGLFDFINVIFRKKMDNTELKHIIDNDCSLISLLLHENLIQELSKIKNKAANKKNCLDSLITISDAYVHADTFEKYAFSNNDWTFHDTIYTLKLSSINNETNKYEKTNTDMKYIFTQLLTKSSLRYNFKKKKNSLYTGFTNDYLDTDLIFQILLHDIKNSDSNKFSKEDVECITKYAETFDIIDKDERKRLMIKNKNNDKG